MSRNRIASIATMTQKPMRVASSRYARSYRSIGYFRLDMPATLYQPSHTMNSSQIQTHIDHSPTEAL